MKNNTAMEELIDRLNELKNNADIQANIFSESGMEVSRISSESMAMAYGFAIEEATALLEKEKRIIVEARATAPVLFGFDENYCKKESEQYFTNTFKKD